MLVLVTGIVFLLACNVDLNEDFVRKADEELSAVNPLDDRLAKPTSPEDLREPTLGEAARILDETPEYNAPPSWLEDAKIVVTDRGGRHLELSWSAAVDSDGAVASYKVACARLVMGGASDPHTVVIEAPATQARIEGLQEAAPYRCAVRANDDAGFETEDALEVDATTGDVSPPEWPQSETPFLEEIHGDHTTLVVRCLLAASDNVGVRAYHLTLYSSEGEPVPVHDEEIPAAGLTPEAELIRSFQGLQPDHAYLLSLVALDAEGQQSSPVELSLHTAPEPTAEAPSPDGPCTLDEHCDDGSPCTDDLCVEESCSHEGVENACDDGDACTIDDHCLEGLCAGTTALQCDDGSSCTESYCDREAGCRHLPTAGPCEDGDPCTAVDTCVDSLCQAGAPTDCDDGNPCTGDACDPDTGCTHAATSAEALCDDGNPCTDDLCDPDLGCVHDTYDGACTDGISGLTGACSFGRCLTRTAAPVDLDDPESAARIFREHLQGEGLEAVYGLGDFNGNGVYDLAVGAPLRTVDGQARAGGITVIYQSLLGFPPAVVDYGRGAGFDARALPGEPTPGDLVGATLAVGDFDGDGIDDLAVAAPGSSFGASVAAGAVYVGYGRGWGLDFRLHDGAFAAWSEDPSTRIGAGTSAAAGLGSGLAAADFDGDGFADLAVSAPGATVAGQPLAGAIFVAAGSADGLDTERWSDRVFHAGADDPSSLGDAPNAGALVGFAMAPGDFDGDGHFDLAVGAPGAGDQTHSGALHVLYGGRSGLACRGDCGSFALTIEPGTVTLPGTGAEHDQLGYQLRAIDLDVDGHQDLLVGAPGRDQDGSADVGAIYHLQGSSLGLQVGPYTGPLHPGATDDLFDLCVDPVAGSRIGSRFGAWFVNDEGASEIVVGLPDVPVDFPLGQSADLLTVRLFPTDGEIKKGCTVNTRFSLTDLVLLHVLRLDCDEVTFECVERARTIVESSGLVREELESSGAADLEAYLQGVFAATGGEVIGRVGWTALAEHRLVEGLDLDLSKTQTAEDILRLIAERLYGARDAYARLVPSDAVDPSYWAFNACSSERAGQGHGAFGTCGVPGADSTRAPDDAPLGPVGYGESAAAPIPEGPLVEPIHPVPDWLMPGECFGLNPSFIYDGRRFDATDFTFTESEERFLKNIVRAGAIVASTTAAKAWVGFRFGKVPGAAFGAGWGFGAGVLAAYRDAFGDAAMERADSYSGVRPVEVVIDSNGNPYYGTGDTAPEAHDNAIKDLEAKCTGTCSCAYNCVRPVKPKRTSDSSSSGSNTSNDDGVSSHPEGTMPATARPSDETQQSLCQESLVEGLLGCLFDTTAGEESVGLICDRDCRVAECTEQTCACQWPDGQTCVATPSDDGFAAGGNLTTENDEQCVSRDEGQDSDACPDYCLVAAMSMGLGPQAGGDPGGGAGGGHQGQVWEDCDSCSMHTPAPDDCAPSSRDCVCSKMGSLPLGAWVTLCGSHDPSPIESWMDGDPVSYQAWTETYAADHAAREAAYRDWYEQWSQANP